ncbi:MAG: hypothetical protein RIS21_282 [Planctomycetota bacterium]|jgi:hypothetical protein
MKARLLALTGLTVALLAGTIGGVFVRADASVADAVPSVVAAPAEPTLATPPSASDLDAVFGPVTPAPLFEEDEQVKGAVDRALRYLAKSQSANGSWIQDIGYKFNDSYQVTAYAKPDIGVTSLALMAFLSGGHLPGRGEFGKVVEKGTDFILGAVDAETGFISLDGSRMYSHAFATLFLAEIYGMTHRADVKQKLQLAVNLTVKSQNKHGSWRYEPDAEESDMSVTVCQVMALRAARNIGIRVPKSTIDRAYGYVVRSGITRGPEAGGFKYQEKDVTRTSFPLTAAGVASLHNAGVYDSKLIRSGIEYLKGNMNLLYKQYAGHYFYWYGHYYASQVFFTSADNGTNHWEKFYWPRIRMELLGTQQDNGSWKNTVGPGSVFATAVASIILQIPYQYLPIFQR